MSIGLMRVRVAHSLKLSINQRATEEREGIKDGRGTGCGFERRGLGGAFLS